MKKYLLSLAAAVALFSLFGCNNHSEAPETVVQLKPMQQSYRGVVPCADCEGIEVSLFLDKDGSWVRTMRYLGGKGAGSYSDYGTWERTAEKLMLRDSKGEKTWFQPHDDALEMLDRNGNPIDSPFNHTLKAVDATLPTVPMAMKGMYRYMADTATFKDCATGRTFLMDSNAQLERGFAGSPEPVLVEFKAHFIYDENPDTGAQFKALKADGDGRFQPGKNCDN
ncbi:envelope stress response activation lipoprotein NlpE [Enterobacteriaceae bacterium 4M9]|nr:envelope stress response activation lipoprotein NlpE [Enterobacteriaceae bacterium 4M9]